MREYINDMISFYKKHWKTISKMLLVFYSIYGIMYLVATHYQEIQLRLFQAAAWINGKLHPVAKEETEISSGLAPEDSAE